MMLRFSRGKKKIMRKGGLEGPNLAGCRSAAEGFFFDCDSLILAAIWAGVRGEVGDCGSLWEPESSSSEAAFTAAAAAAEVATTGAAAVVAAASSSSSFFFFFRLFSEGSFLEAKVLWLRGASRV